MVGVSVGRVVGVKGDMAGGGKGGEGEGVVVG